MRFVMVLILGCLAAACASPAPSEPNPPDVFSMPSPSYTGPQRAVGGEILHGILP